MKSPPTYQYSNDPNAGIGISNPITELHLTINTKGELERIFAKQKRELRIKKLKRII